MKSINRYITEKFQVDKDYKRQYIYHYQPKTKNELIRCIKDKIEKEGLGTKNKPLNLNDIDTSKIISMSYLFAKFYGELNELSENGYFDISDWDVSNVEDMYGMFWKSRFNGDLSDWNVSKVNDMSHMFEYSEFNGNISDWDVSSVKDMQDMFYNCPLEKNPPKWYYK